MVYIVSAMVYIVSAMVLLGIVVGGILDGREIVYH